jgi:hypothetical protein
VDFTVVGSVAGIFPVSPGARSNPRASMSPEVLLQKQDEWRTTLARLADDFVAGVAVVDPKRKNETCRYCAQGLFCRIRESDAFVEDENADAVVAQNASESFD